jgi:hypothetical protein
MYKVVLLPKAEKFFVRADAPLARKLAAAFELLETDPLRHRNVKPLSGPLKGFFRFRVGITALSIRSTRAQIPFMWSVSPIEERLTSDGQGIPPTPENSLSPLLAHRGFLN